MNVNVKCKIEITIGYIVNLIIKLSDVNKKKIKNKYK